MIEVTAFFTAAAGFFDSAAAMVTTSMPPNANATASSPAEEFFNHWVVETLRLVNQGMMPALQLSPSSPYAQFMMSAVASGVPKAFVDFGAMVSKFIDFDEIASWGPDQARPALVIGAANVNSGKLVKFASTRQAIRLEHVLASCAVPSIFPAVEIDGEGYLDGLFSDNPPIDELIRPRTVGEGNIPEEIWLIKINPTTWDRIPVQSAEIFDRRNQLEGNISLFHQLNQLELINDLILAGAFKSQFLKTLEVKTAVRIPRAFADEPMKPYHIPCIEMPDEIAKNLDYLGKVDRSTANIRYLRDQGEAAARAFITRRWRSPRRCSTASAWWRRSWCCAPSRRRPCPGPPAPSSGSWTPTSPPGGPRPLRSRWNRAQPRCCRCGSRPAARPSAASPTTVR